jgi:hypothetical protein
MTDEITLDERDVQIYLDFMQAHYPECVWTWNPDTKPPETGVLLIILKIPPRAHTATA